jgi:hypothetical protein
MNLLRPFALSVLLPALLITGCSQEPEVAGDSLLRHVPADTPYVFVADRHLPQRLRARLADQSAAQLAAQGESFRRLRAQIEASPDAAQMAGRAQQFLDVLQAFFTEFEARDTASSLRELGIEPVTRSVFYGIGLLPAVRLEIADADRLNAMLDRVEQRAGVRAMRAELAGQPYRRIDLGAVDAVIAVSDDFAIAGLLADGLFDRDLPLLLGQRSPAEDLASQGEMRTLIERHAFSGYGEGFIRLDRLLTTLMGNGSGRGAETMQALGGQPMPVSAACRSLVEEMVGGMPRMVIGITRADERQLAMRAIWESSPSVASYLGKLAAPVPGVGSPYEGLIAIGLGIDLPQLRNGIEALLRHVAAAGADCEWVDPATLKAVLPQLNLALGPMTAGIKGFNLHLDELELDPDTLEPRNVRAGLLAAVDDPRGMFALGGVFNPALASVELPSDGSLIEIPPLIADEPGAPPLKVAMKDKALVVLAGANAAATLDPLLGAALVSPARLFAVDYGVHALVERFGGLLDGAVAQLIQQGELEMADELRQQMASFRLQAKLFERLRVSMYANEQGLVVDQVMELR